MDVLNSDFEALPTATLLSMREQLEAQWQTLHRKADIAAMQMMLRCSLTEALIDSASAGWSWLRKKLGLAASHERSPLYGPVDRAVESATDTLRELGKIENILRARGAIK